MELCLSRPYSGLHDGRYTDSVTDRTGRPLRLLSSLRLMLPLIELNVGRQGSGEGRGQNYLLTAGRHRNRK